jgi:hypothetical protein
LDTDDGVDVYQVRHNQLLISMDQLDGKSVKDNEGSTDGGDVELVGVQVDEDGQASLEHGSLFFLSGGFFTYLPDSDFVGTDTFTYRYVDDPDEHYDAHIFVTNEAPTADDDSYDVTYGQPLFVSADEGLLANDGDHDPVDTGRVHVSLNSEIGNELESEQGADVTIYRDGSFVYWPSENPDLFQDGATTYTDSFTYRATDGLTDSDSNDQLFESEEATVTLTVSNSPPVGVADEYTVAHDSGALFVMSDQGVLATTRMRKTTCFALRWSSKLPTAR